MGNYYSQTPKRKYGWRKDKQNGSDRYVTFSLLSRNDYIRKVDLRSQCPPVYDQGDLGSCTANAVGGCVHFDFLKEKIMDIVPSRLFIYYNERVIDGTVNEDSGAEIRDGFQTIHQQGVCSEKEWPYDISKFTDKPPEDCYQKGVRHESLQQRRVKQTADQFRLALIEGYPIAFGFNVYESFESKQVAKTGVVSMPKPGEKVVGGHAVMIVGFDDEQRRFIVRNSWGTEWGDNGYCYFDYDFILNKDYCSDFWIVTRMN